MAFDALTLNAGTGGSSLATDTFTDTDAGVKVMPYGAVAFGALNGPYTVVSAAAGFPVHQQTGATWVVSSVALSSIDTKTPALGQALAAASVPVVLTAAQIVTLTPPAAITGFATETSLASVDAKLPALGQALAVASVPVVLTAAQITTLTPPAALTGFATSAKQDTVIAGLASIDGHVDGVEGSLTSIDAKLPALGQALAAASVPIVLTAAQITTLTPPAAITGFATSAKQDTGNTSLASVDTKTPALGQALAAASVPVVLTAAQLTTLTPVSAVTVDGSVAHDAVDSGAPVKQGFKATTALSGVTLVSDADRTNAFAGVDGVQIVRPHCNLEDIVDGTTSNTDGTATQVIAAAGAGIKQYLTSVVLANTSASNITVDIVSGSTVKATIPVPANGGAIFNPPVPLKPNAAAEAWKFDPSAATSTVYCSMIGFKSKV